MSDSITVIPSADEQGKVLISFICDDLGLHAYLIPTEARVLAAELEEAAWQVEQKSVTAPVPSDLDLIESPAAEPAASWPEAVGCVALGSVAAEPAAPKGMDPELWSKVMNAPITFDKDDVTPGAPSLFDAKLPQPKAIARYDLTCVGHAGVCEMTLCSDGDYVLYAALASGTGTVGREVSLQELTGLVAMCDGANPEISPRDVAEAIMAQYHIHPKTKE